MSAWSSRRSVAAGAAGIASLAALACLGATAARAAEEPPLELEWRQLIPPAPPKPPKSLFSGRPKAGDSPSGLGGPSVHGGLGAGPGPGGASPPGPQPEGRWMSGPVPSSDAPAPVVADLDGKRVRIGGYVVSLDFDSTRVKEFLLVPFVGACIHVPPPPANQIVYVKSAPGFEVAGMFDPVWVTGILKATTAHTGLAEAGYSLIAEKVERRAKE
jgi:hypothetical protein